MRRLKFLNCFIQSFPHSTGEVDHDADVLPIHEGEYRLDRGGILHHFAYANSVCIFRDPGEMGVNINQRIAGPLDFGLRDVKHAAWFEVRKL